MRTKRNGGYTPGVRMPGASKPKPNRAIFGIVLCLLLPPVGLLFLWRMGVFRVRGRMLVTVLATVEMAVICAALMPRATMISSVPAPGTPARVTPAPESDVLTALSNMDQILKAQQDAQNPGATQGPSIAEMLEQQTAEQEEVLNTIVYCVYDSSARLYHKNPVCGNQSNRRQLTVQEAMAEGLGACPDCNPPVYGFAIATQAPEE